MDTGGSTGLVHSPAGTFRVFFQEPKAYVDAFTAGGPACMRCRHAAGQRALSLFTRQEDETLTRLTGELHARKDLASLKAVLAAIRKGTASEDPYPQIRPVMAEVIDAAGTHEILTVTLTPHPRHGKRWFGSYEPVIQIGDHVAAIPQHGGWLTATGEFYTSAYPAWVRTQAQTAQFVVKRGQRVFEASYRPGEYGQDVDTPPRWNVGLRVERAPFPPLLRPAAS